MHEIKHDVTHISKTFLNKCDCVLDQKVKTFTSCFLGEVLGKIVLSTSKKSRKHAT